MKNSLIRVFFHFFHSFLCMPFNYFETWNENLIRSRSDVYPGLILQLRPWKFQHSRLSRQEQKLDKHAQNWKIFVSQRSFSIRAAIHAIYDQCTLPLRSSLLKHVLGMWVVVLETLITCNFSSNTKKNRIGPQWNIIFAVRVQRVHGNKLFILDFVENKNSISRCDYRHWTVIKHERLWL